MAGWDKNILWTLMFLLAGAVGQSVNYQHYPVCAVEGSTVTLPCTFTPPKRGSDVLKVIRVVWCQNHEICQGTTPSIYDSEEERNNSRYRYLGDKRENCTLQIVDLKKGDDKTLRFRMETDTNKHHFTGPQGVTVRVSEGSPMQIHISSDRDLQGWETFTLHCNTTCTFHQLEVTWLKDGLALRESGPALLLGALTAEHSGNYTCAIKHKNATRSLPYSLHVEGGGIQPSLIVSVVFGVLLALCALILVLCIVKRKRAADAGRPAVCVPQKCPDNMCGNEGVEDVSYASLQFKQQNQARPAEEDVDIIYS